MKRFLLWMFGLLALLALMVVFTVMVLVKEFKGGGVESVGGNSLLVLRWDGVLPGHAVPLMDRHTGRQLSLSTLVPAIRHAATDDRIKGILIEGKASCTRAHLYELSQVLEEFRAAGKPIHAHLDMALDAQYQLASLADRLSLSDASAAGLMFAGTALHQTYWRGLMEKLGVRYHVRHVGDAKGFGENFVLDSMSTAVRENLGQLVEDRQVLYAEWVGRMRDLEPSTVRAFIESEDRFMVTPAEALEAGLVDVLESHRQWEDHLKQEFGDYKRIEVRDYVSGLSGPSGGEHVAVLWAEGEILPGRSTSAGDVRIYGETLGKEVGRLADDPAVKAVVLRVESPGGAVQPSEELYLELVRLAGLKPLVVSMGSVAASGGYYISLPGQRVLANPWTVTGSIGVVAMLPDFSGSYTKLGLRDDGVFSTSLSRLVLGRPLPPGLLDALGRNMERIYEVFTGRVLEKRPLAPEDLPRWAGGRVWSGQRALDGQLVDSLGTLDDAVRLASSLAGEVPGVIHYPEQEDLLQLLLSGKISPRDLVPLLGRSRLEETAEQLIDPELPGPEAWVKSVWEWEVVE